MTMPPSDSPRPRPVPSAAATTLAEGGPGAGGRAGGAVADGQPPPAAPGAAGGAAVPGAAGGAASGAATGVASGAAAGPSAAIAPQATAASRPPAARAEPEPLNLARRPFVNTRPVVRVAAILWTLGLLLLFANVTLFMRYLESSQTTRFKLAGLERDIVRDRRGVSDLQGRIGTLQLDQQNREVSFLNRKIDERTFSWSLLFDRMAVVLPDQVRLLQLHPTNVVQKDSGGAAQRSAAGREVKPPPVTLKIHGEAKDDAALLRFVDNLFAHPAFAEPNLENEERDESGLLRFNLTVQYQPRPQTAAEGAERPGAAAVAVPSAPSAPSASPGTAPGGKPAAGGGKPVAAGGAASAEGRRASPDGPETPPARAASPAGPEAPPARAASPAGPEAPPALAPSPAGAGLVRVAPPPADRRRRHGPRHGGAATGAGQGGGPTGAQR
jgi:Tfp pilus assembly protein PilN